MTIENELDSDEQGEKGQAQFRLLCADAKLTCNESNRDRAGFDFVVNDRVDISAIGGLDRRHAPLSCLVQVKTIKAKNNDVKFRLSSLEQIAKDLKPAFIYVFTINEDGTFGRSSIIHLLGPVLAKVLKKLRSEEAAGRFAVNHAYLKLSISNGTSIDATAAALRSQLEIFCGKDPVIYFSKKAEELRGLGYEGSPFAVKMTLDLDNADEFVDVMLGLKSGVKVKISEQSETRFGITLKNEDLSNVAGELTVNPHTVLSCLLTMRRHKFADPILLTGDFVMAASIHNLKRVGGFLFRSKMLNIIGKITDKGFSLSFNSMEINGETALAPAEWLTFFKFMQIASNDNFSLALQPVGLERLLIEDIKKVVQVEESVIVFDIENSKRLTRLAEMSGDAGALRISFMELASQAEMIASGFALLENKEQTPISFELDKNTDTLKLPQQIKGSHVNHVKCQNDLIVWAADVVLNRDDRGEKIRYESNIIELEDIRAVKIIEYKAFLDKVRLKAGGGVLMNRELDVVPT